MVRTAGFQSVNGSSILPGAATRFATPTDEMYLMYAPAKSSLPEALCVKPVTGPQLPPMSTKRIGIFIGIIVLAGAGWYLGSPLFFDTVVDERLPSSAVPLTEEEKATIDAMESLTQNDVAAMSEEERMESKRAMEALGQKMPDTVADEPMASEPTMAVSGMFKDADSFHRGSGTATVYVLPDKNRVLRFEGFSVTNGPALSVYLVRGADGDVDSGFLDLGKLKGNKGDQNYEISADIDLASYKSVIIWCVPFGVTFATATLQ